MSHHKMLNLSGALKEHPLALFADFRRLFAGRLISAAGDKFFSIAIAWWVISRSGGSAKFQLGLVMAVTVIPVVLFGPALGTLVDRSDKRRVMLFADGARALCVFILAWLLYADSLTLPALYSLCFLISAFGPLFESAVSSSILRLTSAEKLGGATATDASVVQLSGVAGSAFGSVLMAVFGVIGAFFLNAVSYLVSFFAVLLIRTDLRPAGEVGSAGYWEDLKGGLDYIVRRRPLLALLSVFAAFNFFIGPLLILIPMIVQFTLKESVVWLAVFETFFALGSAFTSIAASFRKSYAGVYGTFFRSVLLLGLAFGGLYFTAGKFAVCALLFTAGAALGAGNAAALTLFQRTVPDGMKGRFFSVLTTVCYAVLPLTFMLNGFLAEKLSVGFCIAFNSASVLAVSFSILLIPRLECPE